MKKTILVLGGSGFIGEHLLRHLAKLGDYKLVSADLLAPSNPVPSVDYRIADVRDLSAFDLPDELALIVNLAAVHRTPGHPNEAYYETNILGAVEVCKLARRKKVRDIVFTSSISVYGPSEEMKTEAAPLAPASAYGYSKMMAEAIHKAWLEEAPENRLVICRPAVVFGSNERGNFTRLTRLLQRGFFLYPGRKDTIKSCFYVEDIVEALLFAWRQPDRFILFNGCYPERISIEQIVETLREKYFPQARTFVLPRAALMALAMLLKPFSAMGLGIHPERVMKLVRSTNVYPEWLVARAWKKENPLVVAFEDWKKASGGTFA